MNTAENIAFLAESDSATQFRPMLKRAEQDSVSVEYDEYAGCTTADYIFADGSKVRVCAGHMEAI